MLSDEAAPSGSHPSFRLSVLLLACMGLWASRLPVLALPWGISALHSCRMQVVSSVCPGSLFGEEGACRHTSGQILSACFYRWSWQMQGAESRVACQCRCPGLPW